MKLSELIKDLEVIKRQHGDLEVTIYYKGKPVEPSPSLWIRHDKNDKVIGKTVDLMPNPHEETS